MTVAAALVIALVAVLAVVSAYVVVGLATLRTWLDDRREQRELIERQGNQWGPSGSLAAGQAWTSIVGDGPPSLRFRARSVGLDTGISTADGPSLDKDAEAGRG